MNYLLVEPRKARAWGHNNQHVGLLRIANALQSTGHNVEWVVCPNAPRHIKSPDEIYVTSLFTYDYGLCWDAIRTYKALFPAAKVSVGGIYVTIMPEHAGLSAADKIQPGQHPLGSQYPPDPTILPYPQDFAYLFTSYGCDMACTYCATHLIYGQGIRQLSPDRVVDDIRFLYDKGFREIWLGDDNLLYDAENHINVICEKILSSGMKCRLRVPGGMSAKDFTRKTAALMRRAGFTEVSFAIESVSGEIRKTMGRQPHGDEAVLIRALAYAAEVGFQKNDTNVYFIIGLPYQSLESMVDTAIFLMSLGVWAHPQRLTPIPHTVEWKRLRLEATDPADLHYKTYVAPGGDFTGDDLDGIYRFCRAVNMGTRYSGCNIMANDSQLYRLFWERFYRKPLPIKPAVEVAA